VKPYHRHLFVCTADDDWAARIELGGGFLQTVAQLLTARSPEMSRIVKMTACAGLRAGFGHDILLFPDQIRYLNVQESDLLVLVESHLIQEQILAHLPHEPLTGQHIFVCTHGRRDVRCGECGLPLVAAFQAALAERNLSETVTVWQTSHVGGHKFAGNILIYPGGDWYGYVTPADVPRLIEQHLLAGEVITELWRGRMSL
jgi:hypothetical protein